MLDKDFEVISDRAAILNSAGYFSRYAELLSTHKNSRQAWEALEGELKAYTGGGQRFITHASFKAAHSRFHAQGRPSGGNVKLKF